MMFVVMEGLDGRDEGWLEGMLTGGGGLAGIDVADNDDVDVETLVLTVDAESAAVPVERGWMETEISWRWRDGSTRLVGGEGKKKGTYPMVTVDQE